MKWILGAIGATLVAGSAMAAGGDISVSTDPAKIAAIEKHAKELQARDQAVSTPKAAASTGKSKTAKSTQKAKPHKATKTKS